MEPTLLHLDGDSVAVSTGMRLAADLVKILGWKRAYRVAALVRSATQDASFDQSRRSFLIKAAGVAAVLPFAPMLAKAPAPAKQTISSPLTADEVRQAYTRLRASGKFKSANRAAKRDGARHRRDTSELRTDSGAFVADTYVAVLATADDGRRRLIHFSLLYEDGQGERVTGRWMAAVVDIDSTRVLAALDVDAREVEDGYVDDWNWAYSKSHGNPALAAEVNRRMGSGNRLPAGRLRFRGKGVDITLNNGAWSGTPTPPSNGAWARAEEEIICVASSIYTCWNICRVIPLPIPQAICSVVLSVVCIVIFI